MRSLNIGLVGYKFMGKAHSNAFSRLEMFFDCSAHVVKKAICGRDGEWVAKAAAQFGWEGFETSWEKLVSRSDIDVVDITTPSNAHKDIAITAAANGKHIFCESRLRSRLRTRARCWRPRRKTMLSTRLVSTTVLPRRCSLQKHDKLRQARDNQACPRVISQDFIIDPSFPLVWRLQKEVCGSGSLGDLGAHFIDLSRFLVGDIKTVMGMQKTFIKHRPKSSA